ncbi:Hpt domain-containing protein [Flavobacteriaceae bacterium 3-367]|uniref:Hpt domain-containing protein n=1 Tax=Eudoraea algarum TaxID=3417568 RepID=UPI00326FB442
MKEKPNLDYIKQLAGDDSAFEKKFINILKEEFPQEKAEYLGNIKNNLPREAALNVHKLKHKFNVLGLTKSYRFAVDYEESLRMADTSLQWEFLEILDIIENYVKNI